MAFYNLRSRAVSIPGPTTPSTQITTTPSTQTPTTSCTTLYTISIYSEMPTNSEPLTPPTPPMSSPPSTPATPSTPPTPPTPATPLSPSTMFALSPTTPGRPERPKGKAKGKGKRTKKEKKQKFDDDAYLISNIWGVYRDEKMRATHYNVKWAGYNKSSLAPAADVEESCSHLLAGIQVSKIKNILIEIKLSDREVCVAYRAQRAMCLWWEGLGARTPPEEIRLAT